MFWSTIELYLFRFDQWLYIVDITNRIFGLFTSIIIDVLESNNLFVVLIKFNQM